MSNSNKRLWMPNFEKVVELYIGLRESSFFEEDSDEADLIEGDLKIFFQTQIDRYGQLGALQQELDEFKNKTPAFSDIQLKALAFLADAALRDASPEQIVEPE